MESKKINITEVIQGAKDAKEIKALAEEKGITLTLEEAEAYFNSVNAKDGELSDDELDSVAGGSNCTRNTRVCPQCGGEMEGVEGNGSTVTWTCKDCNYSEFWA